MRRLIATLQQGGNLCSNIQKTKLVVTESIFKILALMEYKIEIQSPSGLSPRTASLWKFIADTDSWERRLKLFSSALFSPGKYHVDLPDHKGHSFPAFGTQWKYNNRIVSLCSLILFSMLTLLCMPFPFLSQTISFFFSFPLTLQQTTTVRKMPPDSWLKTISPWYNFRPKSLFVGCPLTAYTNLSRKMPTVGSRV